MASNSEKILGSGLEVVVESAVSCKMEMCGKKQGTMPPEAYRAATGGGSDNKPAANKAGRIPFFAAGISSVCCFLLIPSFKHVQVECCRKIAGAKLFSHPV